MRHCTVLFAAVVASVLVSACDRAPNIAGPQKSPAAKPLAEAIISRTNEQDVPWVSMEQNPCNGDMVSIQGLTHFIFNFSFDGNNGYHLNTRSNSKGTGIGAPSLSTYKVSEEFMFHENNPEGEQFTQSQVDHLLILAPRAADNYIRHTEFKITQNATGVPTASFDRSWTKCAG